MINNEYKNSSEVYKVQTFRTTQLANFDYKNTTFLFKQIQSIRINNKKMRINLAHCESLCINHGGSSRETIKNTF